MDTAKLRALALAATPGSWEAYTDCPGECCWLIRQENPDDQYPTHGVTWPETSQSDAAYIAAAHPALMLRMLDVVDRAELLASNREHIAKVSAEPLMLDVKELRSALDALEGGK